MTQEEMRAKEYAEQVKAKFGTEEIRLKEPVLTISDNSASPFSSGGSGYIKRVRVKDDVLEFYHDWWAYGWYSYVELHKKYPRAVTSAINQILH